MVGGKEWDLRAQPKVALVVLQGHTTEAPQDQALVGVVHGAPDGQNLEHTAVRPKDVVQGQCQDCGIAVGIAISVIVERLGGPLEGPV